MHPKSPKLLSDILVACDLIMSAAKDRNVAHYSHDHLLRYAIERNFEIIGEAVKRIQKIDPPTATRIPEHTAIIGFRNILVHGYDIVDHNRVWQVIQNDVPRLRNLVAELMKEAES
jgi:uncharacterized protein with HEPN domain